MMIKAIVNGKESKWMEVKSQYNSGFGVVYECTNEDGIWVAVEEKTVTRKLEGIRTAFEYSVGAFRVAFIKITAKTEEDAEAAREILAKLAEESRYSIGNCDNPEEQVNGKWQLHESIGVYDQKDMKDLKGGVYSEFKRCVGGVRV